MDTPTVRESLLLAQPLARGDGPDAQVKDSAIKALDIEALLQLELPPREFILRDILRERDLAMLYSWRGVGKTYLALYKAYAIASGGKCLKWQAPKPRKVLYVDGEMPVVTLQQRIAVIANASERQPPEPGFFRIVTPDVQELPMPNLSRAEVQARFDEIIGDSEVVFFDSISTLFNGGRENESESWTPAQEWVLRLRRAGKSVIFIHHEGKSGAQRGTSKREDVLDAVIHLKRPHDYRPDEGARFQICFEKTRGIFGNAVMPFETRLEVRNDQAQWSCKEIKADREDQALEFFNLGMKPREVAGELGIHLATAYRLQQQLRDKGLLKGGTLHVIKGGKKGAKKCGKKDDEKDGD